MKRRLLTALGILAAMPVVVAVPYLCLAAFSWKTYGHRPPSGDPILDPLLPNYEVAEHFSLHINASTETTFAAACQLDLQQSPIVRSIFHMRELALRASHSAPTHLGLCDQARAWGWGQLAAQPNRLIVFGAVTQPWEPNPIFRALPPQDFAAFHQPGYTKILWTLRAQPTATGSLAITETRVATTDAASRAKFRTYWAFVRPGIVLIRWMGLRLVKRAAERPLPRALPAPAVSR